MTYATSSSNSLMFPQKSFFLDQFQNSPTFSWPFPVKIKTIVYLYGTWGACSTSAFITRPRVRRLWLMLPASLALLSTAPDRPMFSDPAKSTCTGQKLSKLTLFSLFYTQSAVCHILNLVIQLKFVWALKNIEPTNNRLYSNPEVKDQ